MIGLILAAGDGKRLFGNGSDSNCKPLVKVKNKNLLSYSLDNLLELGIKKAVIVVGRAENEIKTLYGEDYFGIKMAYARQEQPIGLVNAIISAADQINDDFVLQLSDEIYTGFRLYPEYLNESTDFCVGYVRENNREKIKLNYSIELAESGEVLKCTEKPKELINDLKGTGFCVFKKQMLDLLVSSYGEKIEIDGDLCDFINLLIIKGRIGKALEVAKEEININTMNDLKYAESL